MERMGMVMLSAGIDSTAITVKLLKDGWTLRGIFGRTGLSLSHVECWPHDPSRDLRRAAAGSIL